MLDWQAACGPYVAHYHINDYHGKLDEHIPLGGDPAQTEKGCLCTHRSGVLGKIQEKCGLSGERTKRTSGMIGNVTGAGWEIVPADAVFSVGYTFPDRQISRAKAIPKEKTTFGRGCLDKELKGVYAVCIADFALNCALKYGCFPAIRGEMRSFQS